MTGAIEPVSALGRRTVTAPSPGPSTLDVAPVAAEAPPVEHPAPPRPKPTAPTIRVEVSLSAGVQTVTIYDITSGRPIYQAPPEHTRQVLDKALATPRSGRRQASHG
jgi:hypothetical protein